MAALYRGRAAAVILPPACQDGLPRHPLCWRGGHLAGACRSGPVGRQNLRPFGLIEAPSFHTGSKVLPSVSMWYILVILGSMMVLGICILQCEVYGTWESPVITHRVRCISSLLVYECSFHARFKNVPTNEGLTSGNI